MAGADWFGGFMKRRTAESTSIAKATSFNLHNVEAFFAKLDEVGIAIISLGNSQNIVWGFSADLD